MNQDQRAKLHLPATLVALAAGFAIAALSGATAGVAAARTVTQAASQAIRTKSTRPTSRKSRPRASQLGTPITIITSTTVTPDAHRRPARHHHRPHKRHRRSSRRHRHPSGGVADAPTVASTPPPTAPAIAPQSTEPGWSGTTADADEGTTIAAWSALTGDSSAWPAGLNPDSFLAAALGQTSSLTGTGDQPPAFLIPIYKTAANRYQVPWQVLAAINWIETDYGRNLGTSSPGALGWMQFMPGTWQQYGVAADGHSRPNPYSPQDAILSAAHYLAANGAAQDLPKAIYAYDHAAWYVADVMWRAQIITDHATGITSMSLAGTAQSGLAGAETMLVAAYSAVGGPYSQANHDSFGQTAADLRRAGTDCSGFVSWVLDQVSPGFGNQTTVTLPDQPGILPGVGQYVTMWDRPLPGDQGHVIVNILGTWFESGGNSSYNPAGGIAPMTEAQAVGELTGGGFLPFHLTGL
jgi:membrane-bound lytic murein transglycosylase B